MAKLFAYGTLERKDIQENIFGRSQQVLKKLYLVIVYNR
jgi:hypothetical protein